MLRNTLKSFIYFLIRKYDWISVNGVIVEKNSVAIEVCAICGRPHFLKEYKSRVLAFIEAIKYSKQETTQEIGLCDECSNDPYVIEMISGGYYEENDYE